MVYEEKIVDVLHTALVTKMSEPENMDYPEHFKLNIANVKIELLIENNGRREGMLITTATNIGHEYISVWKSYAPGHFLIRDWKKEIRDKNGNSPYYVVHYLHGGKKMKALLRRLIEVEEKTIPETDRKRMLNDYADLTVDGIQYAIIKICNEETAYGWMTPESGRFDIIHATSIDFIEGVYQDIYPDDSYDIDEPEPKIENVGDGEENEIEMNTLL